MTEDEKKARKKADRERKRQEARDAAEKKKRFGLTPEKKRKLRVRPFPSFSLLFIGILQLLIMKMATDNLKGEQQRRLEARKNYIEQQLKPLDDLHSMSDGQRTREKTKDIREFPILLFFSAQVKALCQQLHEQLKTQEANRYDLEFKVRKQDYDVTDSQPGRSRIPIDLFSVV